MITFSCTPDAIPVEKTWLPGPHGRRMVRVTREILVRENGAYRRRIAPGTLSDRTSWPAWLRHLRFIPAVRRWLRDARGRYTLAALFHDADLVAADRPKWDSDGDYHEALRSISVSALEAMIFYLAVRARRR